MKDEAQLTSFSDPGLTRREVLARGVGAVAAGCAAAVGGYALHDPIGDAGLPDPAKGALRLKNYFEPVDFPASGPRLSVATGDAEGLATDPQDLVGRLVRAAIGGLDPAAGMKRFITPGDVVLIKPNVGFDRAPHLGATTNPEVVRWVIRLSKEAGARRVVVTDNPIEAPEACFARSGIKRVAEEEGAQIVTPSPSGFQTVLVREGRPNTSRNEALGRWAVFHEPLATATKVIGVAPIKDHNLCSASMNLKNWYGLLGGRRNQFHQAIHDTVSDLGLLISPTLVIADGTRVMMRNGPTGGRTSDVKVGGELGRPTIVASVDPVACDAWCYENLLGRDPAKLAYLHLAARKIGEQIAGGVKRFGGHDWRAYERQALVAVTSA